MAAKLFALLVGIDRYLAPDVPRLRGCVNDIDRMTALLAAREDDVDLRVLRDAEATRAAVIDAFRSHLGQAGPDDIALFYCASHGSQGVAPPEFRRQEQDHLLETLVCHDSRTPGVPDLADKELAKLIREVADPGASVVVVLDACHSANGTREPGPGVRRAPVDERPRPVDTFLVDPADALAPPAGSDSGWTTGRHILLAACHTTEVSREVFMGDRQCGIFSFSLAKTLSEATRDLTYREVFKRTAALVRARVRDQNPQLEGVDFTDFDRPFLGGGDARSAHHTVTWNATWGWAVDAGAVHGVPLPDGPETTVFAVFPQGTPDDDLRNVADAAGHATVTSVEPGLSAVKLTLRTNVQPDRGTAWTAVPVSAPLSRLPVVLDGDAAQVQAARDVLGQADDSGGPSLFVREAAAGESEYALSATDDGYEIVRLPERQPVAPILTGNTAAGTAIHYLEHISRWRRVADLGNRGSPAGDTVRLRVHAWNAEIEAQGGDPPELPVDGELRLTYELRDGTWQAPQIKISVANTGNRTLHCSVLVLPETFSVFSGLFPSGRVALAPGERAWALDDQPLAVTVPDEFAERGVVTLDHIVKMIVSSRDADTSLLDQSDLAELSRPALSRPALSRDLGPPLSTLDRLLRRVRLRHFEAVASTEPIADWATSEIKVTVVRPREALPVPMAGAEARLAPGVTLLGHDSLTGAVARLTTEDLATRAGHGPALPPVLRDDPFAHPVELLPTRSGMAGPNVLELVTPAGFDHRGVTGENPLTLRAGITVAAGDELLPVAYDRGFFLPLGSARPAAGGAELLIGRLPTPPIRIYLRRLAGTPAPEPGLAVADRDPDGAVVHERDPEKIRQRVAAAASVHLYVPGFVGDSRDLIASGRAPGELLLTFDHACPDVGVEQCATVLAAALDDAGLRPGNGKPLFAIGHSVGGLIVRWFVERAGGAAVVTQVTLLGTPNGGLSWPRGGEWATVALALGLNGLTSMSWPPSVLSRLLALSRREDPKSGHQLRPDSALLRELAASPDPGVPYLVVAGAAATPASVVERRADGSSILGDLLERLRLPGISEIAAAAFLRAPSDLLVSEDSARRLPDDRSPVTLRVACDHLTYLDTAEVLDALPRTGASPRSPRAGSRTGRSPAAHC